MELLADTRYKGWEQKELELFRRTCNRVQLDPFAGQIMLDRRWQTEKGGRGGFYVYSPYTQIDGFRVIAQRTADYAGQQGPWWYEVALDDEGGASIEGGAWWEVWPYMAGPKDARRYPYAAKVGILRRGFSEPLVSVVRWDAYAQRTREGALNRIWATRGDFQLAKCAEALGLRRATPNLLSGLYTVEEIDAIRGEELARAEADSELDAFDHKVDPDESAAARETWMRNVENARVEDLPQLQQDFEEGFGEGLLPLHKAEVLAAIAKRLEPEG